MCVCVCVSNVHCVRGKESETSNQLIYYDVLHFCGVISLICVVYLGVCMSALPIELIEDWGMAPF